MAFYVCLLAVLGLQGIVVKCTAAIFSVRWISHVRNEQGTKYKCLKSIGVKSEPYHRKEHPRLIQIMKFERD